MDEFVELMLEVAMTRGPTIKIGRDAEYPTTFVQRRFAQITSSHIEKVLDGISENTTCVWNTKAYLLAALFNAPAPRTITTPCWSTTISTMAILLFLSSSAEPSAAVQIRFESPGGAGTLPRPKGGHTAPHNGAHGVFLAC